MSTSETDPITGVCDERHTKVRSVMAASLQDGADLGCGLTIIRNGEVLVDLRGGWQDRQKTTPFGDDLVCVYSSGKAVVSALIMQAVSDGLLDYDAPVATYWPEFAQAGKDDITLAQALSHQAGLAAFMDPIEPALWIDWNGLCTALCAMKPAWPLGSASGYHPQTYGFIAGEILRRATGKSVGTHLRSLGLDVYCGLDEATQARTMSMVKPSAAPDLGSITDLKRAAFLSPWSSPMGVARAQWMAAEIPASNMHASSHGLATIMQAFACGSHWGGTDINQNARDLALTERISGDDLVLPFTLTWAAGLMANRSGHYGPSPSAYGHYGFGGSCVMADPAHGLSLAYVPNKMSPHLVADPRAIALLNAVYETIL